MKYIIAFILFFQVSGLFAQVNIYHKPYGLWNRYAERENEVHGNKCERDPRDPVENEPSSIDFKTWPADSSIDCSVNIKVNGEQHSNVKPRFLYNKEDESFWRANLGEFERGDTVTYFISVTDNDGNSALSDKFTFVTLGWNTVTRIDNIYRKGDNLIAVCKTDDPGITPFLVLENKNGYLSLTVTTGDMAADDLPTGNKILATDKMSVELSPAKGGYAVYDIDGKELVRSVDTEAIQLLNDGSRIYKIKQSFVTPPEEEFYGFGVRYNAMNQRGNNLDNYVVNIWKNQGKKTHIPVPFFISSRNYGLFVNSYYYSLYSLDTAGTGTYEVVTDVGREKEESTEYIFMAGDNSREIVQAYSGFTGFPAEIPAWSMGSWISANEWDRQSEIEAQLDSLKKYDIPATVVVIEAWSDEETFYIFNDAVYKNKPGGESFSLEDFTFTGRWPDPVGMIDTLHDKDMRLILWNIPVLKSSSVPNRQRDIDEEYAIEKGYVVKNADGSPFRMPPSWFGNSVNLDFTNPDAVDWWMGKRKYLVEEYGIDGFRVDGGEFIWGRDLEFADGAKGDHMRNKYPNDYAGSYNKYLKSVKDDAIVFHRAGTFGAQNHPLAWNGDHNSSFTDYRRSIRSCLNSSISGIPFIGYDIAGYHDETGLSPELYKRSTAQAAFSFMMQFHSAYSGDAGLERSPWNIAQMYGDTSVIPVYRTYSNIRYRLLPYLYSEVMYTSRTASPFMFPISLDYPEDKNVAANEFAYMLGRNLAVFPVTEEGVMETEIYLPEGKWADFWTNEIITGGESFTVNTPEDFIPVYMKEGSIIPADLDKDYKFTGNKNNRINEYENLSFFIFPKEDEKINYKFYDLSGDTPGYKDISITEDGDTVIAYIAPVKGPVTLIIKTGYDADVVFEETSALKRKNNVSELNLSSTPAWAYDNKKGNIYIKLAGDNNHHSVIVIPGEK